MVSSERVGANRHIEKLSNPSWRRSPSANFLCRRFNPPVLIGLPPTQLRANANKDTLKLLRLNRVWLCSLNNIAIDVVRAVRRAGGEQLAAAWGLLSDLPP